MKKQIFPLINLVVLFMIGLTSFSIGVALVFVKGGLPEFIVLVLDKGFNLIFGAVLLSGLYVMGASVVKFLSKAKH